MLMTELYPWLKNISCIFCRILPRVRRVTQISLTSLCPRERDQFQKQGCHPDVKKMPAAADALSFGYMLNHSGIINLAELCHYIMEYALTITTPGQICHQFVFFVFSKRIPLMQKQAARERQLRYRLIKAI